MNELLSQADRLRNFIANTTNKDIITIDNETLLFDDGFMDSLAFLSIVGFIKDEFSIEIGGDDLTEENFRSISNIIDFIKKKTN